MSNSLIGIERDVILKTLMQDNSPIAISPVVKSGVRVDSMTLQSNEYRIYPQGILFFKRFLSQWKPIEDLLKVQTKANVRMNVSFYHRGRGIFFISTLNLVQNGYALMLPEQVYKMDSTESNNTDEINASIFLQGVSGVHAECIQSNDFPVFNTKPWMRFSEEQFTKAEKLLASIVNLSRINVQEYTHELLHKTKLLMYLPERKLPEKNHFPFPVTVTKNNREIISSRRIEEEIKQCEYSVCIPLSETPSKKVHTIVGLKNNTKRLTPSDVLELLQMLPVCSFLANEGKKHNMFSHELEMLSIIAITDSIIVLGQHAAKKNILQSLKKSESHHFPLVEGQDYIMSLRIPTENLVRTISVRIVVSKVLINKDIASCAICSFSGLQEEDKRFLYEKYYRTKIR